MNSDNNVLLGNINEIVMAVIIEKEQINLSKSKKIWK